MRIVIVGGQARKVGKTSVIAGIIRGSRRLSWTAVKVSTHDGGVPHGSVNPAGPDRGFVLTEETSASATSDTGRFLAAGARRALWLRVRTECLASALAALIEALTNEQNVIVESGAAMSVLKSKVGIFVLDRSRRGMKPNARRALASAHAFVEIRSAGRSIPPRAFDRRTFFVSRKDYSNFKLNRFVLLQLKRLAGSSNLLSGMPQIEKGSVMAALNETEIRNHLKAHPGWSCLGNALHKKFTFESFMPGIGFVNKIAEAAEKAQHHPDITINYNVVSISLSTHSEGGVTARDFALAGTIDALSQGSK